MAMTPDEWKEAQRPGFEAWFKGAFPSFTSDWNFYLQTCDLKPDGDYLFEALQFRWEGWLAAKAEPVEIPSQVIRNLWRSLQIGLSLEQFTEEFHRWVRLNPVSGTEGKK